MPQPPTDTTRRIPMWLIILGSLAIIGHLGAVVVMVIAAPSGPWASPFGMSMALAPQFAQSAYGVVTPSYLRWIKMTHNYHFPTNRPGAPGVTLEVKLKDASGKVVETLKFPDDKANAFVRHRQVLLVRQLADDQPMPPQQAEVVAAPNRHYVAPKAGNHPGADGAKFVLQAWCSGADSLIGQVWQVSRQPVQQTRGHPPLLARHR